jgi:insertion element IS1 protein InsB
MIEHTVKHKCRCCQSENIVKNGHNACGKQQYRRKDCGAHKVLEPTVQYSEGRKEEILRAYQERSSLRWISRTFGASRPIVAAWLKKTPSSAEGGGWPRASKGR